jgi:hypothetical protein
MPDHAVSVPALPLRQPSPAPARDFSARRDAATRVDGRRAAAPGADRSPGRRDRFRRGGATRVGRRRATPTARSSSPRARRRRGLCDLSGAPRTHPRTIAFVFSVAARRRAHRRRGSRCVGLIAFTRPLAGTSGVWARLRRVRPLEPRPHDRTSRECWGLSGGGVIRLVAGIMGAGRSWTVWMISVLSILRR